MATAVAKALSSPKAQSAIRARATNIAKTKVAEATKQLREKFKRAAPAMSRDLVQSFLIPGAMGTAGAIGVDMVLDRFQPLAGAKGDIAKILAGVSVGTAGRKLLRNSPYVHSAALGVVIVNTYKLATRLMNRGVAGKGLKGLLDDDSNMDLAGYPDTAGDLAGTGQLEAVNIALTDGSYTTGYQDSAGNLYDENGGLIVGEAPELGALPYYDQTTKATRVTVGDMVIN